MRSKLSIALILVIALVTVMSGCSKHDLSLEPRFNLKTASGITRPDSTPHPTPPPDTNFVFPVNFVSADSTRAGTSGTSRWVVANNSRKPFTMSWSLTADPSWPGYPIQGSLKIPPGKTAPLAVRFPVPASAFSGFYQLEMTVTTPDPNSMASAFGFVRVFGNEPPPPPPPPPPAVQFVGADTTLAGTSGQTRWQLTNESAHNFTMTWTLTPRSAWPGFPLQGTVSLGPNASQQLTVLVAVPDTAAAGPRMLDMEVTRPDTLPPASTPGTILVVH